MYEVKEKSRVLDDGTEITTYEREVVSCNILDVEAGTTGYMGGDTGHGGRRKDPCKETSGQNKQYQSRIDPQYTFQIKKFNRKSSILHISKRCIRK